MLKSIHCPDKRMVGRSRSTLHAMPSLRHESEMSMSNLLGTQDILVKVTVAGIYMAFTMWYIMF